MLNERNQKENDLTLIHRPLTRGIGRKEGEDTAVALEVIQGIEDEEGRGRMIEGIERRI
jgi:hypothetical protein